MQVHVVVVHVAVAQAVLVQQALAHAAADPLLRT